MTKKPSSLGTSSNSSKGESPDLNVGREDASIVLSILYGLLVVMLAVVFKVSENITTLENDFIVSNYLFLKFFALMLTNLNLCN